MQSRQPLSDEPTGPLRQRYVRLSVTREPYLAKARKCAELTVPSLIPPEHNRIPADFKTPYQSVGARGVNNLSNKLMQVLFPTTGSFFRLTVGQYDLQRVLREAVVGEAVEAGIPPEQAAQVLAEREQEIHRDLEKTLAASERAAMREWELQGNRSTDAEALKQLVVAGNVLRRRALEEGGRPRIYTLANYVVKRDPDGLVLEIITREGVSALSVDPAVRAACGLEPDDAKAADKHYDLFTSIRRDYDLDGPFWAVEQELNGVVVPESEGEYEFDDCPWLPLRWTKIDGEDYGRGHVEEYLGDLISLEGLSQALLEGAIASSRCLILVDANSSSGTRLKEIARARNGAVVAGNAKDVTFLHSDKYHDLRTPAEQIQQLSTSLGHAFLLTSSVQRDAERVTAQEVRLMAQELETALGGVYTVLGEEYQKPLVVGLLSDLQARELLPELPPSVKPVIVTGMDALGRNTEFQKLMELMQFVQALPKEEVALRLNVAGIINRGAASIGINTEGLLLPEEQVQAQKQQLQQQQQMQAMLQSLGPDVIKAGSQMMQQQGQSPQ